MGQFYEQFIKKEMPAGMIFDVDGTLLDSMPVWAHSGERYLSGIGIDAPESLGRTLFSMTMENGAQYIKKTFALPQSPEEIKAGIIRTVEKAYETETGFKPGADDFLKMLRQAQVPMTVVTSNDKPLVQSAFRRLGIESYFMEIFTCGTFGCGKDNPAIFHAAAACMHSPVSRTWVVEDGLYAIRTAKKAGYRTIGIADEHSKPDEEMMKKTADYFIKDFADELA